MVICLHGGMARPAEADDVVWIVLQPGVIMALDDMVNLGRDVVFLWLCSARIADAP